MTDEARNRMIHEEMERTVNEPREDSEDLVFAVETAADAGRWRQVETAADAVIAAANRYVRSALAPSGWSKSNSDHAFYFMRVEGLLVQVLASIRFHTDDPTKEQMQKELDSLAGRPETAATVSQ
jgi:hypothetical protein